MKLPLLASLLALAACGGKSGGAAHPAAHHVAGDVDGDGAADQASFAGGVVTVGALTFTVPSDFDPESASVVELGPQAIVAVASVVNEDDLSWRVLTVEGGAITDLGAIFLGNEPELPGDGTIVSHTGNCGQSTTIVYRIVDGKISKDEQTTGTYDENRCAACPYVLADTGSGLRFVGESLRNLVGAERATEDALTLPAVAAGTREVVVVLEEVKGETTYLDAIAVDFAGVRVAPRACAGAACTADGQHDSFRLGERRRFVFDVPAGFTGAPVLYARGFYLPFTPTAP